MPTENWQGKVPSEKLLQIVPKIESRTSPFFIFF